MTQLRRELWPLTIDSREQEFYTFACEVIRAKLDAGDYSVVGFEQRVAVERKSLRDFVGTVIHDFDRFARELQKLSAIVPVDMCAILLIHCAKSMSVMHSLPTDSQTLQFHQEVLTCGSVTETRKASVYELNSL